MFKKIISSITLICFFNTQCSQIVWAYEISLEKDDKNSLVVPVKKILRVGPPRREVSYTLFHEGKNVGQLTRMEGHVDLEMTGDHKVTLTNLPELSSFSLKMDGSLEVQKKIRCHDFICFQVVGQTDLKEGFHVKNQEEGSALFFGGKYTLGENSLSAATKLLLNDLEAFRVSKGAHLKSTWLGSPSETLGVKNLTILGHLQADQSDLTIQTLSNNGILQIDHNQLKAEEIINRGTIKSSFFKLQTEELRNLKDITVDVWQLNAQNIINSGTINIQQHLLAPKGSWYNQKNGSLAVQEFFQGNFLTYNDDGKTSCFGFFLLNAAQGRLTGNLHARNGIIRFQDDLVIPTTAQITSNRHLTLHSDRDTTFQGRLSLMDEDARPKPVFSPEIKRQIENLTPGIIISAKGKLSKSGSVRSTNTSIVYSAGGKFVDKGVSQSGFFEGNSSFIQAVDTWLVGELQSLDDCFVKSDTLHLKGKRNIAGNFHLKVENKLTQYEEDSTTAKNNIFEAGSFTLAGGTKSLNNTMLKARQGTFESTGILTSGQTTETDIEETLSFNRGSTLKATDHSFKVGKMFYNGGGVIESLRDFSVDTCYFINALGGDIQAGRRATVNADLLSSNLLGAQLLARHTIINGIVVTNALGRARGCDSLTTNALLNGSLLGINQSNYYSHNSGYDCGWGMNVRDFPDFDYNSLYDAEKPWSQQPFWRKGKNLIYDSEQSFLKQPLWGTGASVGRFVMKNWIYDSKQSFFAQPFWRTGVSAVPCLLTAPASTVLMAGQLLMNSYRIVSSLQKPLQLAFNKKTLQEAKEVFCCPSRFLNKCKEALRRPSLLLGKYGSTIGTSLNLATQVYHMKNMRNHLWNQNKEGLDKFFAKVKEGCQAPQNVAAKIKALLLSPEDLNAHIEGMFSPRNQHLELLKNHAKEKLIYSIGGREISNTLYSWDRGINLMGHQTKRSLWFSDKSWNVALTRDIWAGYGEDYASVVAHQYTLRSFGDLTFGGDKHIFNDCRVHSGGKLAISPDANSQAKMTSLSSSGSMSMDKGAQLSGEKVSLKSTGDLKLAGGINAKEEIVLQSTQGNMGIEETAKIDGGGSAKVFLKTHQDLVTAANSEISGDKIYTESKNDTIKAGIIVGNTVTSKTENDLELAPTSQTCADTIMDEVNNKFIYQEGAKVSGKNYFLKANEVPQLNISNFMEQTGSFAGLAITDGIQLHLNESITFDKSTTSKSTNFQLFAPSIDIREDYTVQAPGQLGLYATKDDLHMYPGVEVKAGVFLDLYAAQNIVADFKTQEHPRKKNEGKYGVGAVTGKGVTLTGGSGIPYEYKDPETNEVSTRTMGLRLTADNQIQGKAMTLKSPGDIVAIGRHGIMLPGVSQKFAGYHYRGKGDNKYIWADTKTAFFSTTVQTPGKYIVRTDHNGFSQDAGQFTVGQGADILANGTVEFNPLTGRKSRKKESNEVEDVSKILNLGDTAVRIWSANGDLHMKGLRYIGPWGHLSLKGENIYLDRSILNWESASSGFQFSWDYSLMSQFMSIEALQATKDLVEHLNAGNYKNALMNTANPSITAGVDYIKTKMKWQTLGEGSILTKDLTVSANHTFSQKGGYEIDVLRDASIRAQVFKQTGAQLRSSTKANSVGVFATVTSGDMSIGLRFGHSQTKTTTVVPSLLNARESLDLNAKEVNQDAGIIKATHARGNIDKLKSRTRQNKSDTKTMGAGFSVGVGVTGKNINVYASYGQRGSRQSTPPSGIEVAQRSDLKIGVGHLKGAKIKGAKVDLVHKQYLPTEYKDRGFSLGISANLLLDSSSSDQAGRQLTSLGSVSGGLSNDGHEVAATFNLKNNTQNTPKDCSKLWNSCGTISYRNTDKGITVSVPIITGINPQAWRDFGNDVQEVGAKIGRGIQNLFSQCHQISQTAEDPTDLNRTTDVENISSWFHDHDAKSFADPQRGFIVAAEVAEEGYPKNEGPQLENNHNQNYVDVIFEDKNTNYQKSKNLLLRWLSQGATEADSLALSMLLRNVSADEILVLERLTNPYKYKQFWIPGANPDTFAFRIKDTNSLLQTPQQFKFIANTLEKLKMNKSIYAKSVVQTLNKTNPLILYHHSAELRDGTLGYHLRAILNLPDHIAVSTGIRNDVAPEMLLAHEVIHLKTPKNISESKMIKRLSTDLKKLSVDINKLPKDPTVKWMCQSFWQCFKREFIEKLNVNYVKLAEEEINGLLTECRRQIIANGKKPNLANFLDEMQYNFFAEINESTRTAVQKAADSATYKMAHEIAPLLAEVDMENNGSAAKIFPECHRYAKKFLKLPSITLSVVKACGMPILDLGFHIFVESASGSDFPDAIVHGGLKCATDNIIYTPIYTPVFYYLGLPAGLALGGTSILIKTLPNYSDSQITGKIEVLQKAIDEEDPNEFLIRRYEFNNMMATQSLKTIFAIPDMVSEKIYKGVLEGARELEKDPEKQRFFFQHQGSNGF